MGLGHYSFENREIRSQAFGYKTKSAKDLFTEKNINPEMNPLGVKIRESRDSDEHPESLAIIIALDETGSMGTIPHHLVKEGLPNIMMKIMEGGIKDPQIMFMGIGDHKVDGAPLQIGQFESSDELMDKWLTNVYLEGGGGKNGGESYLLAWYVASKHTSIDCFEKRQKKGILFTIGDEPTFKSLPIKYVSGLMGSNINRNNDPFDEEVWDDDETDYLATNLLAEAQKMYDVYHIHIHQTKQGKIQSNIDGWYSLLGRNVIVAETKEDVPTIISDIINGKENWFNDDYLETEIAK